MLVARTAVPKVHLAFAAYGSVWAYLPKTRDTRTPPTPPLESYQRWNRQGEPFAAGDQLRNPEKIPVCYLIIIYVLNGVGKDPVGQARGNNYPGVQKRSRRISEIHVFGGGEKIPLARIGKIIIPAPRRSSRGPFGAQDVLTHNWSESQKTFGTAM